MKNLLFTAILGCAVLALSGCGGGGDKKVVKDAAYYKKEFKKRTSLKSLNTDKQVLFTMKSLKSSFITQFDINGTNEGINRDIIEIFKSNLEKAIENNDSFTIKETTPILLSAKNDDRNVSRLDNELKSAITTVCANCKQEDIAKWFMDNQDTLEKSAEENNHLNEADDSQPILANPPPDILVVYLPPPQPPHIYQGGHFVEIQTLREGYNRWVEQRFSP